MSAALTMFKQWSVYPPNSRPVDDSHEDIASPFTTTAAELPLVDGKNDSKDGPDGTILCVLQPLRNVLTVGETFQVTLSCRRPDPGGDPAESVKVPVKAEAIALERTSGGAVTPVAIGGAAFVDDGSHGDRVTNDHVFTLSLPVTAEMTGVLNLSTTVSVTEEQLAASGGVARLYGDGHRDTGRARSLHGEGNRPIGRRFAVRRCELDVDVAGRYRSGEPGIERRPARLCQGRSRPHPRAANRPVALLGKILSRGPRGRTPGGDELARPARQSDR